MELNYEARLSISSGMRSFHSRACFHFHLHDNRHSLDGQRVCSTGDSMTAYEKGYSEYEAGKRARNPYDYLCRDWWDYLSGWVAAKRYVDEGLSS